MLRIALIACLFPTLALADVPISGSFGDSYGCLVALRGSENTADAKWTDSWILVTPTLVSGHEWECTPIRGKGDKVRLICGEAGDERISHIVNVTMVEHAKAGTLTYTDQVGVLTLHRCK